jgi:hypothetical protein
MMVDVDLVAWTLSLQIHIRVIRFAGGVEAGVPQTATRFTLLNPSQG